MRKLSSFLIFSFLLFTNCENFGRLEVRAKLPQLLEEVSGIQYDAKADAFWMLNDSGNSSSVFLVTEQGDIRKELVINARNKDWEDITQDKKGNLYIGDFGNNRNSRRDLKILKVDVLDLISDEQIEVEEIEFWYPEQEKFPPKKKRRYYDTEAFFEWNGFFYIFTKSRVKNEIGRTFLYQVPNQKGKHKAKLIADFTTCPEERCWITSADITKDGKKVVLLNEKSAWIFTNFKENNFFSGNAKEFSFGHESQKESITFKNNNTIYVADEQRKTSGRNLYFLRLTD